MKNWKKYTVLFMTCCLALCTLASAATNDGTFTGYSNRQGYTPRSADVLLTSSKVYFDELKWDSRSRGASEYWEGELRGVDDPSDIGDAYEEPTAVAGSLPYLYKEYDSDDMSVGCSKMSALQTDVNYYAALTTEAKSGYYDGIELKVESEYGTWLVIDGLPKAYQVYAETLNTATNRSVAWAS